MIPLVAHINTCSLVASPNRSLAKARGAPSLPLFFAPHGTKAERALARLASRCSSYTVESSRRWDVSLEGLAEQDLDIVMGYQKVGFASHTARPGSFTIVPRHVECFRCCGGVPAALRSANLNAWRYMAEWCCCRGSKGGGISRMSVCHAVGCEEPPAKCCVNIQYIRPYFNTGIMLSNSDSGYCLLLFPVLP